MRDPKCGKRVPSAPVYVVKRSSLASPAASAPTVVATARISRTPSHAAPAVAAAPGVAAEVGGSASPAMAPSLILDALVETGNDGSDDDLAVDVDSPAASAQKRLRLAAAEVRIPSDCSCRPPSSTVSPSRASVSIHASGRSLLASVVGGLSGLGGSRGAGPTAHSPEASTPPNSAGAASGCPESAHPCSPDALGGVASCEVVSHSVPEEVDTAAERTASYKARLHASLSGKI